MTQQTPTRKPAPAHLPAAFVALPLTATVVTTARGRYGVTATCHSSAPCSKTTYWDVRIIREGDGAQQGFRVLVAARGGKTNASVTGMGLPMGSFPSLDAAIEAMTAQAIAEFEAEGEEVETETEAPEVSAQPAQSVYDWPFARYYWEVQRLLLWNDLEGVAALALARVTKPEVAA